MTLRVIAVDAVRVEFTVKVLTIVVVPCALINKILLVPRVERTVALFVVRVEPVKDEKNPAPM